MIAAGLAIGTVAACSQGSPGSQVGHPQSPKPTENPSAHLPMTIKVTPPEGFAGNIVATADWVIGNHSCAPKNPISGAYREEPVHRAATIRREGPAYFLTAFTDQFVMDACHWVFTGFSIHLYDEGRLVGVAGANDYVLKENGGRLEILCAPDPHVPYCVYARVAKKTFLRMSPNRKVFPITIEGM